MSGYSKNYSEYLSKSQCCDLTSSGPQGSIGVTGKGMTGVTGPTGIQGPIGQSRRGDTGPTGKNFIIEHPSDASKLLIHSCLEGPETGVYYRGRGEITNGSSATIQLPEYVNGLAYNWTIHVAAVYEGVIRTYNFSEVDNNQFTVYGENGKFHWSAMGKRRDIVVEPNKSQANVFGNGPYLWNKE
jgi:hypothetical protein